jgi:hypothetical protein
VREANDRRACRDNLAGLRGDGADDAIRVGPQRRIVDGVARQRHRAVGARYRRARLIGGQARLVEIGVGRPALFRQRRQAALFRLRLNERGLSRTLLCLRLLELKVKIGGVKFRQRIALVHESASVDEPRRHLAGDAEGEIALDPRLDHPGQNLRLLARRIMRFGDQHRPRRRGSRGFRLLIAGGDEERGASAARGASGFMA